MIIIRIYKHQNLLSLVSFLVGLRTYQHPLFNAIHAVIMALTLKMWYKHINKIVSAVHDSTQSNPSCQQYRTVHNPIHHVSCT